MNTLELICIIVAALALFTAIIAIAAEQKKTRQTMKRLNEMLDRAIDGSFAEDIYDESALSAIEAKMARYLSECSVSSKNLRSEKDKTKTLISDISHQTKTPIANILLYSQLLSEYELEDECKVCVRALAAQAEKLNFLISALVKTSRLETGIITVSPRNEAVQVLLHAVTEQIKPKADKKNISVIVEDTPNHALFDLKWTTEALYNIVDNAVKYSPSGTAITIKAIQYELFSRIDITDMGIGIAEEEQSRIFARFYRSQAVFEQEGGGIGLFLAREIIAAEDGYLKVFSVLGNGATFSVFLPVAK